MMVPQSASPSSETPARDLGTPVRVLQFISSLEMGGAEQLVLRLLKQFGLDSTISPSLIIQNDKIHPDMWERANALGIPLQRLNRPQGHKHPKYLLPTFRFVCEHDIQVLHTHDEGALFWATLLKLARPGLKIVHTVHNSAVIPGIPTVLRHWFNLMVDQFVVISQTMTEQCREYGLKKVTTIYNGVHIPAEVRPWTERGSMTPLRLIMVARLTPKKGQDILVRAIELCRRQGVVVDCQLVGDSYAYAPEFPGVLKALVDELELNDQVHFLGLRHDIPELLQQAHLLALPSEEEGLPLTLLEAMANKTPVVASRIPGCIELVTEGETGWLVPAKDPQALADQIVQLAGQPEKLAEVSEAAYRFAQTLRFENMTDAYTALYRRLLS